MLSVILAFEGYTSSRQFEGKGSSSVSFPGRMKFTLAS